MSELNPSCIYRIWPVILIFQYGINVCNGTKPIAAECRVVGSKQPSTQTGNVFSMPCGVDGVQCTDQTNNPCQDYEVRYKCAVYEGRILFSCLYF